MQHIFMLFIFLRRFLGLDFDRLEAKTANSFPFISLEDSLSWTELLVVVLALLVEPRDLLVILVALYM